MVNCGAFVVFCVAGSALKLAAKNVTGFWNLFFGDAGKGEMRGSLHHATNGEAVCCSGRDDASLGWREGQATAKTTADPYGMTTIRTGKDNDEIQGSFPIRLRSGAG